MEKQTQDGEALYGHVPPPGDSIPINIVPHPIADSIPPNTEIREVVQGLKKGRAGGTSKICAENLKSWLRGAVKEEDPELTGRKGAGDNWRLFVKLIQAIRGTFKKPFDTLVAGTESEAKLHCAHVFKHKKNRPKIESHFMSIYPCCGAPFPLISTLVP